MKKSLKEKLKKLIRSYIKNEASTTSGVPGVLTPFAFSKRGARPDTLKQGGYSLANISKKEKDYALENQMYSEPAYVTPAVNIEPVQTYIDKNGLVQHNDPELDPNLVGMKQGQLPMYEMSYKKLYEGIQTLTFEQEQDVQAAQQPVKAPQPTVNTPTPPQVNLTNYNVQQDFTEFDTKLKNSTEQIKTELQKTIQDKVLGKKVVVRAAKGYKQPEMDYTVNVTGVAIDYYYDRYVIILIGREENKQKVSKFFVKPGFPIRILGPAANLKPKDQYQIAKSQALVSDQPQTNQTNTVTSDEEESEEDTGETPTQTPKPTA